MQRNKKKTFMRKRRQRRVRSRISGTATRPRLAVYRSIKQIYAQVIDDGSGRTLCSSSTLVLSKQEGGLADGANGGNVAGAAAVGKDLAKRAGELGIETVRFDRGGNRYHGRVKALADAARESGLTF